MSKIWRQNVPFTFDNQRIAAFGLVVGLSIEQPSEAVHRDPTDLPFVRQNHGALHPFLRRRGRSQRLEENAERTVERK